MKVASVPLQTYTGWQQLSECQVWPKTHGKSIIEEKKETGATSTQMLQLQKCCRISKGPHMWNIFLKSKVISGIERWAWDNWTSNSPGQEKGDGDECKECEAKEPQIRRTERHLKIKIFLKQEMTPDYKITFRSRYKDSQLVLCFEVNSTRDHRPKAILSRSNSDGLSVC